MYHDILVLVGISITIEEYVRLWIFFILAKENSPSTLNRKGWISMPKPYPTSEQLRQYVFPICFSHKH